MLARSSSGRTPLTGPGQWLVFCDHFSAGFLCARVRLVHHHQHPLLHPQMGLDARVERKEKQIMINNVMKCIDVHAALSEQQRTLYVFDYTE